LLLGLALLVCPRAASALPMFGSWPAKGSVSPIRWSKPAAGEPVAQAGGKSQASPTASKPVRSNIPAGGVCSSRTAAW